MKKTVVLGASPSPNRVSYSAIIKLLNKGIEVIPIGIREGEVGEVEIIRDRPEIEDVHTITLYLNPQLQKQYYDYILSLKPKRIIFNPGTENSELFKLAKESGIETEYACTLVLLALDDY